MKHPQQVVRKASLGAAVLGGAFVVGLSLSWMMTTNNRNPRSILANVEKSVVPSERQEVSTTKRKKHMRTAIYSFGYNQFGQLMLGNEADVFTPVKVNFDEKVISVKASSKTSGVLTANGLIFIAGCGMDGRLGTGITIPPYTAPDQPNLTLIPRLDSVIQFALGEFGGAAIRKDGTLMTWGRNWGGENGRVTDNIPGLPEPISHTSKIVQVSRGRQHLCFVDEIGCLFSCGIGREGATGLGSFENVSRPTRVTGLLETVKIKQVECTRDSTFALSDDGRLFSWGNDDFG